MNNFWYIFIFLIASINSICHSHSTGRFHTHHDFGSPRIDAPDGSQFVPKGVNVVSYGSRWNMENKDPIVNTYTIDGQNYTHLEIMVNHWKVNAVRLNMHVKNLCKDYCEACPNTYCYDLDHQKEIIQEFLDNEIVCVLSFHDFLTEERWVTCPDGIGKCNYFHLYETTSNPVPENPSFSEVVERCIMFLDDFNSSSYLWLNLNEPRGYKSAEWKKMHHVFIDSIRSHGYDNIIVCDADGWGQEPNPFNVSYIRRYGRYIIDDCTRIDGNANIVFDVHTYGETWNHSDFEICKSGFYSFFSDCCAKGIPIIIGEQQTINGSINATESLRNLYENLGITNIGYFVWNFYGHGNLVDGDNGYAIKFNGNPAVEKPYNLSSTGSLLWDYIRTPVASNNNYRKIDSNAKKLLLMIHGNNKEKFRDMWYRGYGKIQFGD